MTTEQPDAPVSKPIFSSKVYDVLKPINAVILPGVAALYFALAGLWDLPQAEKVVGTVAAVNVFLGLLLGLSTRQFNNSDAKFDGVINIQDSITGPRVFSLELNDDPELLENKKTVTFRMNPLP
jgi:hypothetical protein